MALTKITGEGVGAVDSITVTNGGSIGSDGSDLVIDGPSGHTGLRMTTSGLLPRQNGAIIDNTIDLGSTGYRYNDLYLGGNLYIGGTGSANALDDYEEGTFTPNFTATGGGEASYTSREGSYTKIGRIVVAHVRIQISAKNALSGTVQINNLPFTVANLLSSTAVEASGSVSFYSGLTSSISFISTFPVASTTNSQFHYTAGNSATSMGSLLASDITNDFNLRATVTYFT